MQILESLQQNQMSHYLEEYKKTQYEEEVKSNNLSIHLDIFVITKGHWPHKTYFIVVIQEILW